MNPLRQTSQLSYKTSFGNPGAARPAARRAEMSPGSQGGRGTRPVAPVQQWRGTPEPAIAPFGVDNDKGHAGDSGFRFGSGPASAVSPSRASRKLMPVLGVGALSIAILAGGVAYFSVFSTGDASADRGLKSAAAVANGSITGTLAASDAVEDRQNQVVAAAMKPVAVKTVTISPELLDKGIMAPNRQGDQPVDTMVAEARWGYKDGAAAKAVPGAGAPAQQTAYASIDAAAAKPWPVSSPGTDEAKDDAAAASETLPAKDLEPVERAPAPAAIAKAKYQDTVNDHVNMRSGPRSRSDVIMVVPKGTTVGVVECRSWCKVVHDGRQGWIYKRYIGSARASAAPAAAEVPAGTQDEAPEKTERTLIQRIISGGDQMSTR